MAVENERAVKGMDEYIEREAAIELIMSEPTDAHYPSWYADKIKEIPTADVAPVVPGRWLHTEIEDDEEWGGTWHEWTCDNCGYSVGHNPNGTNYCPNCGAKIDLEEA